MSSKRFPITIQNCTAMWGCGRKWSGMRRTDDENIRFCKHCKRKVHLITSDEALGRAIRLNQCIAWQLPEELNKHVATMGMVVGEPYAEFGELTQAILRTAGEYAPIRTKYKKRLLRGKDSPTDDGE